MKRSVKLACLAIFLSIGLNAQTEKGRFLIGLSSNLNLTNPSGMGLSFGSSKYHSDDPTFVESDGDQNFTFNLKPRVGYFLMDNLAMGIDFDFHYFRSENGGSGDIYEMLGFAGGPFLRYYYPIKNNFLFGEVYGNYGKQTIKFDYAENLFLNDSESETLVANYGLAVGMSLSLTERTFFDCSLGYDFLRASPQDTEYDEYTTQQGLQLKLGFSIILGE